MKKSYGQLAYEEWVSLHGPNVPLKETSRIGNVPLTPWDKLGSHAKHVWERVASAARSAPP